ncbi:MAG: response regulator transcription factor [Burkholderiales bacterium]
MTITIVIADDHVLFRQGLAALLREQPGWAVVGEAGSGEEAVELVAALTPDVALLDVEMPGIGGIDAARRIHEISAGTKIVALSMYTSAHYQERMLRAGAAAYLRKSQPIDELVDAVRAVLADEVYDLNLPTPVATAAEVRSARVDADALSEREREVLRLLAQGKRTAVVAEMLGISHKTVETYRTRLQQKLGINDLSGLVRFAIRAGLIALEP